MSDEERETMEKATEQFILNESPVELPEAHHYSNLLNVQQGLDLLSCLINYHWLQVVQCDGETSSDKTKKGQNTYMSVSLGVIRNLKKCHLPASARNRFVFFTVQRRNDNVIRLVQHIFKTDQPTPPAELLDGPPADPLDGPPAEPLEPLDAPPPPKRRKFQGRSMKVADLLESAVVINETSFTPGRFMDYCIHVRTTARVWCQEASEERRVLILPEVDEDGAPCRYQFVHVTVNKEGPPVTCTCQASQLIQQMHMSANVSTTLETGVYMVGSWTNTYCVQQPLSSNL